MTTKNLFFHLKYKNGHIQIQGAHRSQLGHTILRSAGEKPDGIYAQWDWDGKRFSLINDRYGMYPVYYYWHNNELCVSSSITTILSHVPDHELDYEGLAVFLRLGFFIGDHTPFKHIRAVPPGAHFVWQDNQLTVQGDILIYSARDISLSKAADQYISLFREAIKRRLPDEEFIALLSGGRDSRYILIELNSLGYQPSVCLTTLKYPPYFDDDIEKAELVTKALNIKHIVKYHTQARLRNEIQSFKACNFCSDEHTWLIDGVNETRGSVNIVYDGMGGDVTAVGEQHPHHLELMKSQRFEELAHQLFREWNMPTEKTLSRILHPDLYNQVSLECATESLIKEFRRHGNAVNPANSFYFWNRTRREIALCFYGLLDFKKTYSPYLDYDFFDFLWSLPLEISRDRTLQTKVIQQAYPALAHIPFDQQKSGRSDTKDHYVQFTRDVTKHWLKKLKIQSHLLNLKVLWPHLLKGLLKRSHCEDHLWIPPLILLYLTELESSQ